MGKKQHTAEQIIRRLQGAELEPTRGQTTADVGRKLGFSHRKRPRAMAAPLVETLWGTAARLASPDFVSGEGACSVEVEDVSCR